MTIKYQDTIKHVFGKRTPRTRQLEFIEACFDAMSSSKPIVIEGPTGLGKSLGMISSFMPFVVKDHRVIYTTRTISQLENLLNELSTVLESKKFKDISLSLNVGRESARKWACNQDSCKDCSCSEEEGKAADHPKILDFEGMKNLYEKGICPYRVGRFHTSNKADIVLSTYSRVLNESYRREYMGMPDDRAKVILVFDEAHNFFEDVVDKPFIDIGYFEQGSVSDSPALDLYELKFLLISAYLRNTSRYVFDKLKQRMQELLKKVNQLLSSTLKKIRATDRERNYKTKKIKDEKEFIKLIEKEWIPNDKKRLKEHRDEVKRLDEERRDIDHEIKIINKKIIKYMSETSELSKIIDNYNEEIRPLTRNINDLYDKKEKLVWKRKQPGSRSLKADISEDIGDTFEMINELKDEKKELSTKVDKYYDQRKNLNRALSDLKKKKSKLEKRLDIIISRSSDIKIYKIPPIEENISNNLERVEWLKEVCKELKEEIKNLEVLFKELNLLYQKLKIEKDQIVKQKKILDKIITTFSANISNISKSLIDPRNIAFKDPSAVQLTKLFGLSTEDYFETQSVTFAEEAIGLLPGFIRKSIDFYNLIVGRILDDSITGLVVKEELSDLFSNLVFDFSEENNLNYTEEKIFNQISEFNRLTENIITCPEDFVLEARKEDSIPYWSIFTLNPKQKIHETIAGCHSSIFLSGTISPVEVMASMVSEDAVSCKIESEFPVENFNSYGVIGVNTSYKPDLKEKRFRANEHHLIKKALRQALSNHVNAGIFVSSKIVLNEIYPIVVDVCKEKNRYFFPGNDANIDSKYKKHDNYLKLCQKSGFESRERDVGTKIRLIKHCAKLQTPTPLVMIDIIGGQMAEGVNYNDKEMEMAVLIGIPYPDITEDMEKINLRIDRLMELTGEREIAEGVAFRYTAIRKLAQTCGRVHRSKTDKGTIVLMDERLLGYKTRGNGLRPMRESSVKTIWDIMHSQIKETISPTLCRPKDNQALHIPSIGRRQYASNIEHAF